MLKAKQVLFDYIHQERLFTHKYTQVNKIILAQLYKQIESIDLTNKDYQHIKVLVKLANIYDLQACLNIQSYITLRSILQKNTEVLAIQYLFGYISKLSDYQQKHKHQLLRIYTLTNKFKLIDQPVIYSYIQWCFDLGNSPHTILTYLLEINKLERYMYSMGLNSISSINPQELYNYLANHSLGTKARKYYALKSLFVYYRKNINYYYQIPKLELNIIRSRCTKVSTNTISKLFKYIENSPFNPIACQLLLILELGINYQELKTLSKEGDYLLFHKSSNYRTQEYQVKIHISELSNLLQTQLSYLPDGLVCRSNKSQKHNSYISTHTIRTNINKYLTSLEIKSNIAQLQRAYLRYLAKQNTILHNLELLKNNQHSASWKVINLVY